MTGCEINDHPYAPSCLRCQQLVAVPGRPDPGLLEAPDRAGTARSWPLRTPRVGDLIGDVDPIKVAEGRTLGDPETVHYGLVPRTNRGIFSVNELPDLAERIQVALLNVLEERDVQVRGYTLRLPLDLLLVVSANPEDYTNRGRIITPLKDRFGAEIRTHYPIDLADELAVIRQEAQLRLGRDDGRRPGPPGRDRRPLDPAGPGVSAGRPPLRGLRPLLHRRHRDRRRLRRPTGRRRRRAGGGRPGLRPARRRPRCPRQGRVRGDRGGPRAGGARPPAAQGHRRHLPRPARRRSTCRAADPLRRGRTSSRPATWCRPATSCRRSGPCPAWRSCWRSSASSRSRPGSPPPRWSSPSRGCTSTAGWPRSRSATRRPTAATAPPASA